MAGLAVLAALVLLPGFTGPSLELAAMEVQAGPADSA
jgi:hypothetical protein